jgi:hypothetical protein
MSLCITSIWKPQPISPRMTWLSILPGHARQELSMPSFRHLRITPRPNLQ